MPLALTDEQEQLLLASIQVEGLTKAEDNLEQIFAQLACGFEREDERVLAETIKQALRTKDYSAYMVPRNSKARMDMQKFMENQNLRILQEGECITEARRRMVRLPGHEEEWKKSRFSIEKIRSMLHNEYAASPNAIWAARRLLQEHQNKVAAEKKQAALRKDQEKHIEELAKQEAVPAAPKKEEPAAP